MNQKIQTTAVRLYGKMDLRLETFELPEVGDGEILAHVVSDSICMSSHKAALQGADHKRVPADVAQNPTMIGHEFCGEIVKVGKKWEGKYREGSRFVIQPALNYQGSLDAPGYSYRWLGGDATYVIMPREVMEMDCLLPYDGDAYYYGSLTEPMSCIVGAFRASYHVAQGSYDHQMGIKPRGTMAILAGVGRVSELDGLTLISNSDLHYPANLARNANLFLCDLGFFRNYFSYFSLCFFV